MGVCLMFLSHADSLFPTHRVRVHHLDEIRNSIDSHSRVLSTRCINNKTIYVCISSMSSDSYFSVCVPQNVGIVSVCTVSSVSSHFCSHMMHAHTEVMHACMYVRKGLFFFLLSLLSPFLPKCIHYLGFLPLTS